MSNKIQNKGKSKKNRKTDEEVIQIIRNLRLIDDVLFEKFMEDAAACEELLQVILENSRLKVKPETLVAQKSLRNLAKRSVRLDAYIEGVEDKVYPLNVFLLVVYESPTFPVNVIGDVKSFPSSSYNSPVLRSK